MRKRTRNGFIVLALIALGLTFYLSWPREPVFEGRRLSEWLEEVRTLGIERPSDEGGEAARQSWEVRYERACSAIRSIGPSALPQLLRWLRSAPGPSPFRDKVEELLDKQSWLKIRLPVRENRAPLAYLGFSVLGSNAIPALPELSRLLAQPAHASGAAACLSVIGPVAHEALTSGLTNSNPNVQQVVLRHLLRIGTQLEPPMVPLVIRAITNGLCPLDDECVHGLGNSVLLARALTPWLGSAMCNPTNPFAGPAMRLVAVASERPEQYLPIFSERLAKTNFAPDAAFALARVGPAGVPPLLRGMTNQDLRIRGAALAAVHPELKQAAPGCSFSALSSLFDRFYGVRSDPMGTFARLQLEAFSTALCLEGLLDHPEVSVRLQIVELLSQSGPNGAFGLSRAAVDGNDRVRVAAQAVLTRLDLEVRDGAIIRGPRDKKQISLIFTGHEYAEGAEALLDELARHKATASFFLTGDFLRNPAFKLLVQRICDEGHYLGPHSDKHLLYCSWEQPKRTLVTREEFEADFASNLSCISDWAGSRPLPGYFVPPYEHCSFDIVAWAGNYFYVTLNPTPGTRSGADYTGEADRNFVPSQAIFDSIVAREQQDPHGLNGFILLLHLGSGPGRKDKFHPRFGQLLDHLAAKGYLFVAVDRLIDPQSAEWRPTRTLRSPPAPPSKELLDAFRERYGLQR